MNDQANKLSCILCKENIPKSAEKMPEVADYVSNFCSIECKNTWVKESDKLENLPEIISNPTHFYSSPNEILSDNHLTDDSKLKILKSWEHDAIELQKAEEENMGHGNRSRLSEVKQAIISLQESTKL